MDSNYRCLKENNGNNYFYCLSSECNGLRHTKCSKFNQHRKEVHSWGPITLHVGVPHGFWDKLRFESNLEIDRYQKNYDIEYHYKKNRKDVETTAIRKEVQNAVHYFF